MAVPAPASSRPERPEPGGDGDRITAVLQGLDESQSQQAIGLGLYVCGFVVNDVHREGATDDDLRKLAQQIVKAEADWVALDTEQVALYSTGSAMLQSALAYQATDQEQAEILATSTASAQSRPRRSTDTGTALLGLSVHRCG
jgi:hypothetical protein